MNGLPQKNPKSTPKRAVWDLWAHRHLSCGKTYVRSGDLNTNKFVPGLGIYGGAEASGPTDGQPEWFAVMIRLRQFFEESYSPAKLRSASISSLKLWAIAIRKFDESLGRQANLDDLTDINVAQFAKHRRATVSAATVNRDLASLLALWRFAAKLNLVSKWPTVELEREPKRVPVAWLQEEFDQLMRHVSQLKGNVGDYRACQFWRALLLVCFDSAERISAVLDLQWSNVDLRTKWVLFPAETRKGKAVDSIVPIASDTAEALKLIQRRSGKVFPYPYSKTYIWQHYGAILRSAGLPDDRKHKFHCVRRTVASYVEANGGNATDVLRHASRHTTLSYLDPRIVRPQAAIDRIWRPAK